MRQLRAYNLSQEPPPSPPTSRQQGWINRLFGATPENPLRIPISTVPVEVSFSYRARNTLLAGMGIIGLSYIIGKSIEKK